MSGTHLAQILFEEVTLPVCVAVAFSTLAAAGPTSDGTRPRNEKPIADVEAGRVETARASWWGFHREDATKALQAALDSRAKRVVVERMDGPWIVNTIHLPSDKEVFFEPGVVVEAKRGGFLGKSDCLFVARGSKRLALRGEGATFRMHKGDYHKPPYPPAEWRHALSLRGCEDVTVEGLTLAESGGDGIYLGVGAGNATNRNITIRNVDCDGNNRQGISVITAENLLIENCVFRNTRGTAPQAGIDFEPNHPEERLVNCVLRSCRSEDNGGHAYHLYLGNMHAESPPVSIRFEDCTSRGCERYSTYVGVANRKGERTVRGSIKYVGCRFDADRGAGIYIRGNEADGCTVRFEACEIIRRDAPDSRIAPITIVAPQQLDLDAGNVEIVNCLVRDSLVRQPIAFSASPFTRLRNVSGSLTVDSSSGKTAYVLNAEQLQKWFPAQRLVARIPRLDFDWRQSEPPLTEAAWARETHAGFRLRREATMVVWTHVGRPVELTAVVEPVGRHNPKSRPIELTPPEGETSTLKPRSEKNRVVYSFTPQVGGPHRVHWRGDNRETFRPLRCTEPIAILSESSGVDLFRPVGTLRFVVPSGVTRYAMVVTGAGSGEMVKAIIRDAAGQVVAEQDDIAAPHAFLLERGDRTVTEFWSITFERASQGILEDVSVQTLGIPPLFGFGSGDRLDSPP